MAAVDAGLSKNVAADLMCAAPAVVSRYLMEATSVADR